MNNVLTLFFGLFLIAGVTSKAQTCMGKHGNEFTLALAQQGVEFYYRINHCENGDEILVRVNNTNNFPVNLSYEEKAFSANQVKQSGVAKTLTLASQSSSAVPSTCNQSATLFSLPGWLIFPEEVHPEDNYYPEILSFEVFNVNLQ